MTAVTPASRGQRLRRPTRAEARFALVVLLVINMLNYADRYILPAILPRVQHDLQISDFEAGLLNSAFLLVYGLTTLPLGIWADRTLRKNIVSLCVGLWSLATAITGLTRNFIQLFITRSVLGIGEAGYAPASLSLLGDYFPPAQRGRVLSYWAAATLIGSALGFVIGGLIADTLGWRWAFYVVGLPGLVVAFLAWRLHEPARGSFEEEEAQETQGRSEASSSALVAEGHASLSSDFWRQARAIVRIPTYWVLLGALICSFFTIGGTSAWLPTYLFLDFHLTLSQAGLLAGALLVGSGLVGTVLGGLLADRAQRRFLQGRLLVATLGFLIGAPLALLALLFHQLSLFVATLFVAGVALNFCTGPLNAVIQDVVLPEVRATALGLALLLAHLLGDASAPALIGLLKEHSSLHLALLSTAPSALLLAGLICLLGLRTVARDMQQMQRALEERRQQGS
ncbi:spinster family MFS transporter [Thermogemmatispora onikobensis]|uniref:spinster family MFS transporter n=1 Tax=Thermogemmatispora onikobensis TaxID=732234 RepID=UPI0008534C27|nr:MFS transporter [Thermogemmatispora onikobensis]